MPDDKQEVSGDCGSKHWRLAAPTLLEADTRPEEPAGKRRTERLLLMRARPGRLRHTFHPLWVRGQLDFKGLLSYFLTAMLSHTLVLPWQQ